MSRTRREYLLQVQAAGGARRGTQCHQAVLDENKVRAIRARYGPSTARQLADEFGVHVRTVEKVVSWRTWTHVL